MKRRRWQELTSAIGRFSLLDHHQNAELQIRYMADAFGCDLTRVGTLIFDNLEETGLSWLRGDGGPIYDDDIYRSWEDLIHYGGEVQDPDLETGLLWYSKKFSNLLQVLAQGTDPDGDNLLDTTLVLWLSEFGDGWSHSLDGLPVILAGAANTATGQFQDFRSQSYSTNDLYLSILQAFGQADTTFGYDMPELRMEPILGLI